jgi:hypothetical protein
VLQNVERNFILNGFFPAQHRYRQNSSAFEIEVLQVEMTVIPPFDGITDFLDAAASRRRTIMSAFGRFRRLITFQWHRQY